MEQSNINQPNYNPVITLGEGERVAFLTKVYQHLALALVSFIAFEYLIFSFGLAEYIFNFLAGNSIGWLAMIGGLTIVSMVVSNTANSLGNPGLQYISLFGLAAAEALIFSPMFYYAFNYVEGESDIASAVIVTVLGFIALTAVAFLTRRDLSFLRPIIIWASIIAFGLIAISLFIPLELGIIFSLAMIGLSGAAILYQTQRIYREYPEWAYVGAAVALFGSIMMMFWYVLRIFLDR